MPSWNCLNDTSDPLVLDASVLINLSATGSCAGILSALPNRIWATEQVAAEVRPRRSRQSVSAGTAYQPVKLSERLETVSLKEAAVKVFQDLVSGPGPQTLGDGEAATISLANEEGAISVMDDRKALRICNARFPDLRTASTMDILTHRQVCTALGERRSADLVFEALQNARMRVPNSYLRWTVNLIGQDRADLCLSLSQRVRRTFDS